MDWQRFTPLLTTFGRFGKSHPLWMPLCLSSLMEDAAREEKAITHPVASALYHQDVLPEGASTKDSFASYGYRNALFWMIVRAQKDKKTFSMDLLKTLYTFVHQEEALELRWRQQTPQTTCDIKLVAPSEICSLLEQFFSWFSGAAMHPVHLAAETLYALMMIHPFQTAQRRLAVLTSQFVLLSNGYPLILLEDHVKGPKEALLDAFFKAMHLILQKKHPALSRTQKALHAAPRSFQNNTQHVTPSLTPSNDQLLTRATTHSAKKKVSLETPPGKLLKIGPVAKAAGETIPTIRHWTKEGLLAPVGVTASQYALYAPSVIDRIKKIQALKKKRFTLFEIKAKLAKDTPHSA
ncbi:MAG: MerR family transcriptional regulator [Holosporaceae bacterium]